MSGKVIVLGAGAAPGVPSLCMGWGHCNPDNPKNMRLRTSTYVEIDGVRFLIDTCPDVRTQLVKQNIRALDCVLYTHAHADHVHGIDDLREINRIMGTNLDIYGGAKTIRYIKHNFSYLIAKANQVKNVVRTPSLVPHVVKGNHPFYVKGVKVTPIKLLQHCPECLGFVFNDGEYVHVADFKRVAESAFKIVNKKVKLLVVPLTTPYGSIQHASLDEVRDVIARFNPVQTVINHMASECDYDEINAITEKNVFPAYDGLKVVF